MKEVRSGDTPRPYNVLIAGGEIIVVPRSRERPAGFASAFAGLEMAGGIVVTDFEQYGRLTARDINRALSGCGIDKDEQLALEHRVGQLMS
jgi:ATP adenylyltransferase/5',5'''-P-1,P-4-tetraphosphate phosphorylase II